MSRPAKEHIVDPQFATNARKADAPALATNISARPSRLKPRGGRIENPSLTGAPQLSWPRQLLRRLIYWLVCVATVSLFAVAVLRVFYHDGTHLLIWLNAFARYVYLPAYACLAWAILRRHWRLALANLAIVSFHVTLLWPDFVRDRRFDPSSNSTVLAAADAPTVRIFFANVRGQNTEHQALLEEIKAADPDVIVLVEFSWAWYQVCRYSPVFKAYPYGGGMEYKQPGTANVFSKIPLKSAKQDWFYSRGVQTIEIPIGSETLHIIGLHAPRPQNVRDDNYEGFWSCTIPIILAEKGPLVVVGDFNATQFSAVYQQLAAHRLRSAHEDRGRGYATTWPNSQYWLPSLIRIDQALLSPEVECLAIKEGHGRGSDHKPLILDVKIRPTDSFRTVGEQ
jgi:endonuclease/exonuclease/phosphatase (EEP) superfamily protein YafD